MRKPNFFASVYWIIKNEAWEVLFTQRWEKANWFCGRYQLPAWYIDGKESVFEALKREMQEELMINVLEEDISLEYTSHRTLEDWREYFDFYFCINNYTWELTIWEPDKCSALVYRKQNAIEDLNVLRHDVIALDNIERWVLFAEVNLKDSEY